MRKKANNRVDMSGKTYNSWEVIEVDLKKSTDKKLYWKAKCLECNNIYSVWGANIRSGASKRCTKCGCKHTNEFKINRPKNLQDPQERALKYQCIIFKKNAKRRQIAWQLNIEQVRMLIFSNCHYCGQEPSLVCNPLKYMALAGPVVEKSEIIRNGIDRINSDKGYTFDNVVPACWTCNSAKSDMSTESFLIWISKVYHNINKP